MATNNESKEPLKSKGRESLFSRIFKRERTPQEIQENENKKKADAVKEETKKLLKEVSRWSTITTEEAKEATKKLCTPEQIKEAIKGLQELLYLNPGDDIKEYDARVQEAYKKFQIVHRANSAILDIAEKDGKPVKNDKGETMQTANGIIGPTGLRVMREVIVNKRNGVKYASHPDTTIAPKGDTIAMPSYERIINSSSLENARKRNSGLAFRKNEAENLQKALGISPNSTPVNSEQFALALATFQKNTPGLIVDGWMSRGSPTWRAIFDKEETPAPKPKGPDSTPAPKPKGPDSTPAPKPKGPDSTPDGGNEQVDIKTVYELVKNKSIKIDGVETLVSGAKVGKFILSSSGDPDINKLIGAVKGRYDSLSGVQKLQAINKTVDKFIN